MSGLSWSYNDGKAEAQASAFLWIRTMLPILGCLRQKDWDAEHGPEADVRQDRPMLDYLVQIDHTCTKLDGVGNCHMLGGFRHTIPVR